MSWRLHTYYITGHKFFIEYSKVLTYTQKNYTINLNTLECFIWKCVKEISSFHFTVLESLNKKIYIYFKRIKETLDEEEKQIIFVFHKEKKMFCNFTNKTPTIFLPSFVFFQCLQGQSFFVYVVCCIF